MSSPRWKIALLLLHLSIFINCSKGQEQDYLPPTLLAGPSSVNASVNSKVTFSCTFSNVDFAVWYVNGSSIDTVPNLVIQSQKDCVDECMNETYVYKITFTIGRNVDLNQLNNSRISCAGFQESVFKFSNPGLPALLLIQDVLSSPTLYYGEIANGSMWLKWNAPYTLLGVQIYWYYVNITISSLETSSSWSFKVYVEEASFDGVDSCDVYQVDIQAVTLAGLGQQTSASISRTEAPESLSEDQIEFEVSTTDEKMLLIFEIYQLDCPGRYATSATIDIYLQEGVLHSEGPYIDDPKGTLVHTVEVPIMYKHAVMNSTITLSNSAGSTPSENIILDLSCETYYEVTEIEFNKQMVSCEFGLNCDTKYCVVLFQSEKRPGFPNGYFFILERQENSTMSEVITLDCGSNYDSTCENTTLMGLLEQFDVSDNNDGIPLGNCCITKSNNEQNSGDLEGFSLLFCLQVSLISCICGSISTCCSLLCFNEYYKKRDKKKRE